MSINRFINSGLILIALFVFCSCNKKVATVSIIDNYNDWEWDNVYVAKNDFISLAVVPEAGGRILEYNLGDVPSLWVNSKMFGKSFAPTDDVKRDEWRNFGGYRLVPIPRENCGINREGKRVNRWPPPAIIGDSPYDVFLKKDERGNEVIIAKSGVQNLPVPVYDNKAKEFIRPEQIEEQLQYSRELYVGQNSSKVFINHIVENVGEKSVKRGVMISSQHKSESKLGQHDGENYVAYIPFDTLHLLPSGEQFEITSTKDDRWRYVNRNRMPLDKNNPEHVEKYYNHGTNWTGEVAPGIFEVHYDYDLMSGLHIVAAKPWICYVNKVNNTAFVKILEPFDPVKHEYDHGLNMAIFCSGLAEGYLETEIKTPLYNLGSGDKFEYQEIHGASVLANLPVLDVNSAGIITKKLTYSNENLSGKYGVFYKGDAILKYYSDENKLEKENKVADVNPLKPFVLNVSVPQNGKYKRIYLIIKAVEGTEHLIDSLQL